MTKATRILAYCAATLALATSPTIAQETLTRAQYEKMVREHKDRAIKKLASDAAEERCFALYNLLSSAELSSDVANTVIEYLTDLREQSSGNTVAAGAAELLAEHPRHARRAITQLLKLLALQEKYFNPALSAARALAAIDRRYLEEHIAGMTAADRKALAATLSPVIQSDIGSLETWATVCEIYSMLGADAIDALDAIRAKNAEARMHEKENPFMMVVRLRSESALRIIQSGWKTGDLQYIEEMRRADVALGKPDAYIKPGARFSDEWTKLLALMKKAAVKTGYVIRHENNSFPFQARAGGLPMARLIASEGYSFLFEGLDLKGQPLPQKTMILLNAAGKKVYAHTFYPAMNPKYVPLVRDFVFIEIGVNGRDPLNQFFKADGNDEGYDENILYVYWPRLWWDDADSILPKPPPKGKQLRWLKVTEGKVVSATVGK